MPRKSTSRQLHLRRRDLAILRSLAEARYLSIQALEWLFWPTWWQRWQTCQERGARYRVSTGVYQRLRCLTEAGVIAPLDRPIILAEERHDSTVYALTPAGLHLLATRDALALPVATASLRPPADPSAQLRQIQVGRVYAALRASLEAHGGALQAWRAAHSMQPHAEVEVSTGATGRGQSQRITITPDATGQIQRPGREPHRAFVEVARSIGTDAWQLRVRAYDAYLDSPRYRVRYGDDPATVLVVVTNEHQRERLMHEMTQVARTPERYLFGLVSQIHPTRITAGWRQISHVTEACGQRSTVTSHEIALFA